MIFLIIDNIKGIQLVENIRIKISRLKIEHGIG